MSERIDIVISETGSKVVKKSLDDIADSALKVGPAVKNTGDRLGELADREARAAASGDVMRNALNGVSTVVGGSLSSSLTQASTGLNALSSASQTAGTAGTTLSTALQSVGSSLSGQATAAQQAGASWGALSTASTTLSSNLGRVTTGLTQVGAAAQGGVQQVKFGAAGLTEYGNVAVQAGKSTEGLVLAYQHVVPAAGTAKTATDGLTAAERQAKVAADEAASAARAAAAGITYQGQAHTTTANATKLHTSSMQQATGAAQELAAALATLGLAAVGSSVVKQADAWTTMQNRLRLTSNTMAEVGQKMDLIYTISQKNYASISGATALYAKLDQALINLNKNQADAGPLLDTIQIGMRMSGTSAQAAEGALDQFGQAINQVALRGDELNSVMDGLPGLAALIAYALKKNTGELKTMGEQGALTTKMILDGLVKIRPEAEAVAAGFKGTFAQSFTYLENAVLRYIGKASDASSISSQLSGAIKLLADNLNIAAPAATALAIAIGAAVAVNVAQWMFTAATALTAGTIAMGKLTIAVAANTAALVANAVAWLATPFGAAFAAAVALALVALYKFRNEIKEMTANIPVLGGIVGSFVDRLNGVKSAAASTAPATKAVGDAAKQSADGLTASAQAMGTTVANLRNIREQAATAAPVTRSMGDAARSAGDGLTASAQAMGTTVARIRELGATAGSVAPSVAPATQAVNDHATAWRSVGNGVREAMSGVSTAQGSLATASGTFQQVGSSASAAGAGFREVTNASRAATTGFGEVRNAAQGAANGFTEIGLGWTRTVGTVQQAVPALQTGAAALRGTMDAATAASPALQQVARDVETTGSILPKAAEGAASAASGLGQVASAAPAASGALQGVSEAATGAADGAGKLQLNVSEATAKIMDGASAATSLADALEVAKNALNEKAASAGEATAAQKGLDSALNDVIQRLRTYNAGVQGATSSETAWTEMIRKNREESDAWLSSARQRWSAQTQAYQQLIADLNATAAAGASTSDQMVASVERLRNAIVASDAAIKQFGNSWGTMGGNKFEGSVATTYPDRFEMNTIGQMLDSGWGGTTATISIPALPAEYYADTGDSVPVTGVGTHMEAWSVKEMMKKGDAWAAEKQKMQVWKEALAEFYGTTPDDKRFDVSFRERDKLQAMVEQMISIQAIQKQQEEEAAAAQAKIDEAAKATQPATTAPTTTNPVQAQLDAAQVSAIVAQTLGRVQTVTNIARWGKEFADAANDLTSASGAAAIALAALGTSAATVGDGDGILSVGSTAASVGAAGATNVVAPTVTETVKELPRPFGIPANQNGMSQYAARGPGGMSLAEIAAAGGTVSSVPAGSSVTSAANAYRSAVMAFATGGSFKVGGSGGTDSQPVKFWATPGEKVTVTTPEQEDAKFRRAVADAVGVDTRVAPGAGDTYNINIRSSDYDTFRRSSKQVGQDLARRISKAV